MRILLTAFEPYDQWTENSSWLALVELLRELPRDFELITRRYPVDLAEMRSRLETDLHQPLDAIIHLGQSPGAASVKLEAVALNVAGCIGERGQELPTLVQGGPHAYRSLMPLGRWAELLRTGGVPAQVSYHAGTFLCNATMYLSHHRYNSAAEDVPVGFIHLPLATEQVSASAKSLPSLPRSVLAGAVRVLLDDLAAWLREKSD